MKAYKPYSLCPMEFRPMGILPEYPWVVQDCIYEEEIELSEQGYHCITDQEYADLLTSISTLNYISTMKAYIEYKLDGYRKKAPTILKSLYSDNTIAGITPEQSNMMFDDYADIVMRLNEGAWPTAITRLHEKVPSGFVTQALIDKWVQRITENL